MDDAAGTVTYSQFGEDRLLDNLLPQRHGFYVDVGAHDPWRYSNTAMLHLRGWRGLNIDADPRAVARLRAARPDDINVHCGVGEQAGELAFALFEDGAVNSFDPGIARAQSRHFGQPTMLSVPIETLAGLLGQFVPPDTRVDYLNIDCEGLDEAVLRGNDWSRFRPPVLSVELHAMDLANAGANESVRLLRGEGYVLRAHYFATSVFHHRDAM